MLFEIPDVGAPILVAPRGFKGHFLLGTRRTRGFLQAVELPVGCHDAGTGGQTHRNSLAQQRGVHAPFPKQWVLLELADLISDRKRRLARGLSCSGLVFES